MLVPTPSGGPLQVELARADASPYPGYVQLVAQEPAADAAAPAPLDPPERGEGPHFAYAVQWFIFSAIAGGGYLLILRKVTRERRQIRVGPHVEGI